MENTKIIKASWLWLCMLIPGNYLQAQPLKWQREVVAGDTTSLYVAPDRGGRAGPTKSADRALRDGTMLHPFTSMEEAKQAIRKLRKKLGGRLPAGGVTVRLRGGIYELSSGFVLGKEDSGTEESPVIYTAFPGERVILSGGKKIAVAKGTPVSKEAAQRILSKDAIPSIREIDLRQLGIMDYGVNGITGFRRPYINAPMELFINSKPYHLARYPNDTKILLDTGDVVDNGLEKIPAGEKGGHPGKIRFDKERLALWAHATGIIAAGNFAYAWATDQLRVAAADPATGVVSFADTHPFAITGGKEWNQYFFFNLLEEIDQPGEYYIDHQKGKLYFYPLEPLRSTDTIEVSMLEDALVSLKGADFIRFRDMDFEAGRGIGVYMENTLSDRVENCTIRNMGVLGVCIGKGSKPERVHRLPDPLDPVCPNETLSGRLGSLHELLYENTVFDREGGKNNGVTGCRIENTGCGGISLGGGSRMELEPAGNYVYNCQFTNCGRIDYSYKSPVNIDGVGNSVRHCLFDACAATAIYLHGNNHLIEYNIISEACHFVDDQGAIYMGRDPSESGNTIRWNFFKNIGHGEMMTMAVYFDDGACGSEVYGNVFYKAGTRTIMVGGGSYNHIFNNVFIGSKMALHLDDRLSNWAKHSLDSGGLFALRLRQVGYDHAPYSAVYPWLAAYFRSHPEVPQHNDIENNVFAQVEELHNGSAEWGPIHADNLITQSDPGFVDPAGLNFTLKKEAEVFKRLPGFKPIPFSEIGLIKNN
ncbi:MAG TPA: right-handed parallel beta-helix repeat-containing protein [Puia sp.]|nr:right-handed parallel beta-helix repeat-containing protein [Puia sp.]